VVTLGCFDLSATLGPATAGRLRTLGALTERLSQRHGGLHVDFADHPDQHAGVLGADGLHINARGHAIVAATLLDALSRRRTSGNPEIRGRHAGPRQR
jgi:lysophospholipase L1-like esterase